MENSQSHVARERVLADLKALASDTEDLLRVTASDVSEKAKDARSRVLAALDRAKSTYADLQEKGLESAKAAAMKTDETIRARPYEAMGIAFGVGILIGVLLPRK
jgi:ElaB/YqjD/DUF883 family membrane-anchored ribosome-binding protein